MQEGVSLGGDTCKSVHYGIGHEAPARSFRPVVARLFEQHSTRMICWEMMGHLVTPEWTVAGIVLRCLQLQPPLC